MSIIRNNHLPPKPILFYNIMPKKIAVVAAGWLGDNIMLGSLLRKLQQQGHHTTILNTHAHFIGLFTRIEGIDAILDFPLPKKSLCLRKRWQCATHLKAYHFDEIIYAPNTFKSALIGFFAGIPLRSGWHGEERYILLNKRHTNKSHCRTMVQTYVQLAYRPSDEIVAFAACPEPRMKSQSLSLSQLASSHGIKLQNPHTSAIMLCPGAAAGETKRWPIKHYIALSNLLLDAGYAVHILGGPGEIVLGNQIQMGTHNRCTNWTGKTNLTGVVDVMQHAQAVVANDSGLMHMAAALSKPVMAIYGATPAYFAPPLTTRGKTFSVNLPCKPCGKNNCPLNTLDCLHGIKVMEIFQAIRALRLPTTEKPIKST